MDTATINQLTDRISADLAELAQLMSEPDASSFNAVREGFECLEKQMAKMGAVNAAFAWMADKAEAGQVIGSPKTMRYFTEVFGITYRDACNRLKLAKTLFDPPADPAPTPKSKPEPVPEPKPEMTEKEKTAAKKAEEEQKRAWEEEQERLRQKREKEKKAQEETRESLKRGSFSQEVLAMINHELDNLNADAEPGRLELFNRAVNEATVRSYDDLRGWLRDEIREANRRGRKASERSKQLAAYEKCKFWIGKPDGDRGRWIGGYLAPSQSVPLLAAITAAMKADTKRRGELEPDYVERRTFAQRQADALEIIAKKYLEDIGPATKGVATLLISMTVDDVKDLSDDTLLTTNTGDQVNFAEILRMGLTQYDIATLHDKNGQVLELGRTSRTASFFQKAALVAQEGVCTCGQCSQPAIWCDVHHIVPWSKDGPTDLANLTLLCRSHHTDNNDEREPGKNKAFSDKDPLTGRTGFRRDVGKKLEFNETVAHNHCNGARLRNRRKDQGGSASSPATPTPPASEASTRAGGEV